MPRIRSIKPDFFKDEDICSLPMEARLFFAGLWCQADRNGVIEYRPKRLKIEIMPFDEVDVEAIISMLERPNLHRQNKQFVTVYEHDGHKYIQICGWSKHQHPHHLEKPSGLPKLHKPLLKENNGSATVKEQINTVEEPSDNGANPLVSCLLSPVTCHLSPDSHTLQDEVFQKLLAIYPAAGQQTGVADGTAAIYFREEVIHADHGPLLQAARNYAASKQVRDGYCRQIINFLRGDWWRNWVEVKNPSGADYQPDMSLYEERDRMLAEQEARDAAGIPRGPQRRPEWSKD